MTAPAQYALLHHAAAFARQLEAAGLPVAWGWRRGAAEMRMWWGTEPRRVLIGVREDGSAGANGPRLAIDFRVGDPLPDALVAAIRSTAASDAATEGRP